MATADHFDSAGRGSDARMAPLRRMTIGLAVVAAALLGACATRSVPAEGPIPGGGTPPDVEGGETDLTVAALDLSLCPIRITNAPANVGGRIVRDTPLACLDGVRIHVAPAQGACLSSGFGPRSGRIHAGIDYHSRPAVDIVAAAAGVVRVAGYREKDFGNWVVIDHGNGVFTGYAHLAKLAEGISAGERIEAGRTLGRMGSTGRASNAVHLHYEVRRGDFDTPRRWWGLAPVDPFTLPEHCSPGT